MKAKTMVALLSCIALALCLYVTPSANAASAEEEVLQVATNFVKAINESNSELFSSVYYQSPITTYFNPWGRFLNRGGMTMTPPGVSFALNHPEVTMLGDNAGVITGYFTVTTMNEETNEITNEYLRETLVVQKIGGKWLIVHEHCSMQP